MDYSIPHRIPLIVFHNKGIYKFQVNSSSQFTHPSFITLYSSFSILSFLSSSPSFQTKQSSQNGQETTEENLAKYMQYSLSPQTKYTLNILSQWRQYILTLVQYLESI